MTNLRAPIMSAREGIPEYLLNSVRRKLHRPENISDEKSIGETLFFGSGEGAAHIPALRSILTSPIPWGLWDSPLIAIQKIRFACRTKSDAFLGGLALAADAFLKALEPRRAFVPRYGR
jgi:hypothetical protein